MTAAMAGTVTTYETSSLPRCMRRRERRDPQLASPAGAPFLGDDDRAAEGRADRRVGRHRDHEVGRPGRAADRRVGVGRGTGQDARVQQVEHDRERDGEHHIAPVAERATDLDRHEGAERAERVGRECVRCERGHREASSWVGSVGRERDEGVLEIGARHLEVADAQVRGEERTDRRIAVGGREPDRVAADVDVGHAGQPGEHRPIRARRVELHRPAADTRPRMDRPVPSATIRPWSRTMTRSAISSASSR